jgi:peroxiredoxin-like protein
MVNRGLFSYETKVRWVGGKAGVISGPDVSAMSFGAPAEFGGAGHSWTPAHFYVAAADACLMNTFLSVAEASSLSLESYVSEARGTMEWIEGAGFRMTRIEITPTIRVPTEAVVDKAARLIQKAEKLCLVARSMTASVVVSPRIEVSVLEPALAQK